MKILEFGNKEKPKIVLIHGFQCPYQIWNRYIARFEKDFHILVPVVQGHDVEKREVFTSFSENAKAIEDYIIPKYGNSVYAIYGISMGGVLTAHLWQSRKLNFEHIIFDGSPLVSCNKIFLKMFEKFYLNVTHKTQKRDSATLERAVGSIVPKENLDDFLAVLDNMTDETIKNCTNAVFGFKLAPNIDTPNTKIHYFHGTTINELYAKKSARFIKKHYPNSEIIAFKGKGHCEIALFEPDRMITELEKILL